MVKGIIRKLPCNTLRSYSIIFRDNHWRLYLGRFNNVKLIDSSIRNISAGLQKFFRSSGGIGSPVSRKTTLQHIDESIGDNITVKNFDTALLDFCNDFSKVNTSGAY